jgi:hypothetical protein
VVVRSPRCSEDHFLLLFRKAGLVVLIGHISFDIGIEDLVKPPNIRDTHTHHRILTSFFIPSTIMKLSVFIVLVAATVTLASPAAVCFLASEHIYFAK